MRFIVFLFVCIMGGYAWAQDQDSNYKTKTVAVGHTVVVDSSGINPHYFYVTYKNGTPVDSLLYAIDFPKGTLSFNKNIKSDSVRIKYLKFPSFLTKTYKQLDEAIIVENTKNLKSLHKLSQPNTPKVFVPFDGLNTSGSISRGVTIGNNQNSVLNSELDLQITGKLNDKVSLRASIQDANIPLQESGYSQRLDEFDQVFIELYSDKWNVRAGDIDLENTGSFYANFSKRVQGLLVNTYFEGDNTKTHFFAAGALVRGQFTRSQFTAQEGNQGPYKLQGPNGELYVLIVSGSETVYVNGSAVKRGENNDYIIDYNAGEIVFNPTFPITSEMRITVDYQYSERNYSRIMAYGGGAFESDKLKIGVSIYSENDAKNQPLQQNLSEEQIKILSEAGDDSNLMLAPSEIAEPYNENRILYKKELINGVQAFVFSNNSDDQLYRVTFTQVGTNQGDYVISSTNAVNNIYEYVGQQQGNYAPIIKLVAPTKLQMAIVNGQYKPLSKTTVDFEIAASKSDLNLFSSLDDANNNALATKLKVEQNIVQSDSSWQANVFANANLIGENFKTIEQLYNAEFNRDWNLSDLNNNAIVFNQQNSQTLIQTGFNLLHPKKGLANYQFEHLGLANTFSGNRHVLIADIALKRLNITSYSSFLNTGSVTNTSTFLRSSTRVSYSMNKSWAGSVIAFENNKQKDLATKTLTPLSQKFSSYKLFFGIGDSTKIFTEIGYKHRINDSIRNNALQKVNTSNMVYINSQFIKNTNTHLALYANYRTLKNHDENVANEHALNSRLQYNQNLFKQIITWQTLFETNSGSLPQQDFTYVQVEPGQGAYTWIDYNNNGIQELEEFEIAQFQDQGKYIRVLLPNRIYVKTHQNRFSQTLTINPIQWAVSKQLFKKLWSHFYNQTTYLIDRKIKRNNSSFDLNPFKSGGSNQLGLQLNFKNTLFYNRGKQHYTCSYTYINSKTQNLLSIGFIENNLESHQLLFNHKIEESWLITLQSNFNKNENLSENFSSKNYNFNETLLNPKLSYLFNDNSRFDLYYQHTKKANTIGGLERLKQQKYGSSFTVSNANNNLLTGEFNFISNNFNGTTNTPVAYQILEGLQPGKNFTWSLLAQKRLTKFLDLNLSYFGRKTQTSKTIHTGSVQLKAYF